MSAAPEPAAEDAAIRELDASLRRHIAATHRRRAGLELEGAAAFAAVTQALLALRAPSSIVNLCAQAISEEMRHSEIYLDLARLYADAMLDAPRPAAIPIPAYPAAGPNGESLLRVVGMCCINETMACTFLELCFAAAKMPRARQGLHEVLADEIRHARVGWAYLGSGDVGAAERTSPRRVASCRSSAPSGATGAPTPSRPSPADRRGRAPGCPLPEAIARASLASMRTLVLPGFARAGVDVTAAEGWIAAGAA